MPTTVATLDFQPLIDIVTKSRLAGKHPAGNINGYIWRGFDFEMSAHALLYNLFEERIISRRFLAESWGHDELRSALGEKNIALQMHSADSAGNRSFNSYQLGTVLRHYVNDYCRMLEPLVNLLQQKTPTVSALAGRKSTKCISINLYLKRLDKSKITTPLEHSFFISLYDELWNDYKHAESSGVRAGSWMTNGSEIMDEPSLEGENLQYFSGWTIQDFVDKSLVHMKDFFDYIA